MTRNNTLIGAMILGLLFLMGPLHALEKTAELGKDALWKDMTSLDGATTVAGKWGFKDLVLSTAEYVPDPSTEFLFHFDMETQADAAGRYAYAGAAPSVSPTVAELGGGSAVFDAARGGAVLTVPGDAAFSPGAIWQDFTIEFWAFPSLLSTGETLFSWEAAHQSDSGISPQVIRVWIKDRRLVWDFQNVFTLPNGATVPVTLSGTRQLLPREWHHHLLRYDSTLGLLEYVLDDAPEAVVHVTDTGREGGSVALARLSARFPGQLALAPNYTGYLDELRMSRSIARDPVIKPLADNTGTATSRIIDLGNTGTRISRITADYATPSDTGVEFSYKISDTWTNPRTLQDAQWTPFVPGTDFKDTLRGRYIQLRVELFPNGNRNVSPRVSSLAVTYEPNLPPTPPVAVVATPGNGVVTLSWRRVTDVNVKGYRVFYGTSPHNYLGTGATPGDSPIDVGDVTGVEVGGLENGKLYYFALASYDTSQPPQLSVFSMEVSARPSQIYPKPTQAPPAQTPAGGAAGTGSGGNP